MPALNAITSLINTALSTGGFSGNKFDSAKYNAIAEVIKTFDKEGETEAIYIVDDDGEAKELVYDDTNIIQIFHKVENLSYQVAEPNDYGNPGTTMQENASLKMVFFANRKRIRTRFEQVVAAAVMSFPKEFTATQISPLLLINCTIDMGDVNTDAYSVWGENWPGSEFGLKPGDVLFSINYRVVSNYNKNCFTLCQ